MMKENVATAETIMPSTTTAVSAKDIFLSLRPYQWTKNLIIFAALIFAKELNHTQNVLITIAAFIDFCFLSSAVYLINDVLDYKLDRHHPVKRNRPIASGRISRSLAVSIASFLFISTLGIAFFLNQDFFLIAIIYTLVTFGYSTYFKTVAILDVMAISIGFVLRAIAGGEVIGVKASFWLLLCTFLLSLFLALAKRRNELVVLSDDATKHRTNLAMYSPYLLDQMIGVVTASCVLAYTLYTVSDETIAKFQTDHLSFTVPFVIFGIFRYLYLIHQKNEGGSPSKLLLSDKPLLISILLWILTCVWIIYGSPFPWVTSQQAG